MDDKPLYIPLILGTARQGRQSEHVANFVLSEMKKRPEIETELIDVRQLKMRLEDAGEAMKDPEFAKKMTRADGSRARILRQAVPVPSMLLGTDRR